MLAVDTNVLVRWILRDDEPQAIVADAIMAGETEVSTAVLMELGWVLGTIGGMNRKQVADSLAAILSIATANINRRDALRWAIERYRKGGEIDDLIHVACVDAASGFATFDRGVSKAAGRTSPVPVQTLRV
jgi:predicted nucleic-acid-binding protein